MHINTTWMTIVGSGLWLFGCCAFANAVQDWAARQGRHSERRRRLADLGE